MQTNKLSISNVFSAAWEVMEDNFLLIVGTSLLAGIVGTAVMAPQVLGVFMDSGSNEALLLAIVGIPLVMCSGFVTFWMNLGKINVALRLFKKQPTTIKDLFMIGWMPYLRGFVASLLVGLINGCAMFLVIPAMVPGGIVVFRYFANEGSHLSGADWAWAIIPVLIAGLLGMCWTAFWSIRFAYFPIAIMQSADITESLKISWRITKGNMWRIGLLGVCQFGVMICGLLAFGIGLVVAVPFIILLDVAAFRELSKSEEEKPMIEADIDMSPLAAIKAPIQ